MEDSLRLNARAVLLAPLGAFLASLVLAFCAGLLLFAVALAFDGGPSPDSVAFTLLFLGLFVMPPYVLCGYLASWMAQDKPLVHAGIAGLIFLVANILMALPFDDADPMSWSDILCYASIVPLGLVGAIIETMR